MPILVLVVGFGDDLFFSLIVELTVLPSVNFFVAVVSGDFRTKLFIETTSFIIKSEVLFDRSMDLSLCLSFDDETLASDAFLFVSL